MHSGPVLSLSYDVDGDYIISGGQDKTIILSQAKRGLVLAKYLGHTADILTVTPSSDHKNIFSSGIEKYIFMWDVSSSRIVRKLPGHSGNVNTLCLFPQTDDIIASGSYDSTIRVWDLRASNRHPIQTMKDAKDSVSSISLDHTRVVSG